MNFLRASCSWVLSRQLKHAWEQLRDNSETISIQDPANPTGNDLSELLNAGIRSELSSVSERTLQIIHDSGWEGVFGPVEENGEDDRGRRIDMLKGAAAGIATPTRPWFLP